VAPADSSWVGSIGRLAERRGDYIRLSRDDDPEAEAAKSRLGTPHTLNLNKQHFRDVLSCKAAIPEHPGLMELKGILLLLKWVCRSCKNFSSRLVALIDAKAALAAVAKGRTGSPSWRPTLAAVNAHFLASNILFRPLYIPSEDNPSDGASRGRRRRPDTRRFLKHKSFSAADKRLHNLIKTHARAVDRLRETGMLSDWTSTTDSHVSCFPESTDSD